MLHTEPSFAIYADEHGLLDDEKGDLKVEEESGEFSFEKTMGLKVENDEDDKVGRVKSLDNVEKEDEQIEEVGINGFEFKHTSFDEGVDVEEKYKRMIDEDPSNPVFLKKYAHLLQSNGDLNGAEEYYLRATLADPKDAEILVQYAKLVWELHHDQDRALSCFQSAVNAAPEDSDVLAAYASFMWEIDEENNEATTVETKGDLEEARAVKADPANSDAMSQYAQLVWELHRNQEKASGYFERAVEVAPTNSDVLAAYAKFLWEAEDEDSDSQNSTKM